MPRILRMAVVTARRGVSRSTHYNQISQGLMTHPVSLGSRARGWPEDEIEAINSAQIAGNSDEEIRALVKKLEAARKFAKQKFTESRQHNHLALVAAGVPAAGDDSDAEILQILEAARKPRKKKSSGNGAAKTRNSSATRTGKRHG